MKTGGDLELFTGLQDEIRRWPGITSKNASRLIFNLLGKPQEELAKLSDLLLKARERIRPCSVCCAMTEWEVCRYCIDSRRDKSQICVVATQAELFAIREAAAEYRGLFHVLGGLVSPLDGITPADLAIDSLLARLNDPVVKELIFAFSPTPEGEVTISYIQMLMNKQEGIALFKIASGVAVGANLEFADRSTLLQAFTEKRLI